MTMKVGDKKIKKILLTGDDGYNSIGTRLLIRALKDKYQLHIAATKHQQSGVGGKLSLATGGNWGEDEVDGVPAFWAEGSPCDVMECAQTYFSEPFDLLISGMNLGANVTSGVVSSGTYNAAVRGLSLQLAPQAIAFSWDCPSKLILKKHETAEDISNYYQYPGNTLESIMKLCLENNLWNVAMLNINLPKKKTQRVRFTKFLKDVTKFYGYPIHFDRETFTFDYERVPYSLKEKNVRYDSAAVAEGFISITPCAIDMTHFETFVKLENTELSL